MFPYPAFWIGPLLLAAALTAPAPDKRAPPAARARFDAARMPELVGGPAEDLTCSAPCTDGVLTVAGSDYVLFVDCADGSMSARTAPGHPLTLAFGPQNVLFGGVEGEPEWSELAFHAYTGDTSYINPSGGQACAFDPPDTAAEPLSGGIAVEWQRSPMAGVDLVLREEVVSFGDGVTPGGVRLTLAVTNRGTAPAEVGLRWLLDYQNASDDGPLAEGVGCGPVGSSPAWSLEHELVAAEVRDQLALVNNTGLPQFRSYLATAPLRDWSDSFAPDRLVYAGWNELWLQGRRWDYVTREGQTGPDDDSAVLVYAGAEPAAALVVAPGATVRRSVLLFADVAALACPWPTCDAVRPVAAAGADVVFCPGATVRLDGAGSSAPDCGSGLEYRWREGLAVLADWSSSAVLDLMPTSSSALDLEVRCRARPQCVGRDRVALVAEPGVVAAFDVPPSLCFGCAGVPFTDRSSGAVVGWSWDFGDGTASAARHPVHRYRAAGDYPVRLTATDRCGRVGMADATVALVAPPVAGFTVASSTCAGVALDFANASSADADTFLWDFGDGSPPSTAPSPSHTYGVAGVYTVSLVAANACGSSEPATAAVTVLAAPQASFASDAPRCAGPVSFTDTSSGQPIAWRWDFGDGTTAAIEAPSHTYANPGTYPVSLSVTGACGASDVVVREVSVGPDIGAGFARWDSCTAPRTRVMGPPYSVEDTTLATTASTSWEFDDGSYCPAPCDFAMYVVADCGTALELPLYDNETGRLRIFDVLAGQYRTFDARGGGTGACAWEQLGVTEASWRDCAGTDCRWNNLTTVISLAGTPAVCGIYRLEFIDWGGYAWDLYANCDGSNREGFTVYDSICEARAAYAPLPELSIDGARLGGACPDFTVEVDVHNGGCRATDVRLRASSGSVVVDQVVSAVAAGATRTVTLDIALTDCVGELRLELDPDAQVTECSEAQGASVSCNPDPGAGHVKLLELPDPCATPPEFCGLLSAVDLDPCAASGIRLQWPQASAAGSGGVVTYDVYRDDGLVAADLSSNEWIDAAATADAVHRYRVQAINSCGLSDPSWLEVDGVDRTGPGAVVPQVTATDDCQLEVTWDELARSGVTYDVHRHMCPASGADPVVAAGLDALEWVDTSGAVGATWCYAVTSQALCGSTAGPSSAPATVVDRTPPLALGGLSGELTSACVIELDWTVIDGCGALRYEVYRSSSAPVVPSNLTRLATTAGLPFVDTVSQDGSYVYRLRAVDGGGQQIESAEVALVVDGCAVGCTVANLTAREVLLLAKDGSGGIDAHWSEEPGASEAHLNATTDRGQLAAWLRRPPDGPAEARCDGVGIDFCNDPSGLDAEPLRFYRVLSACGPESAQEGP